MLFQATPRTTKIGGFKAGNELDCVPILNIPSFVICQKLTQMANGVPTPCMPAPTMWQDTYEAKVGGGKALLKKSCIQCTAGQGKIEFITSGQAPLPPDVLADIQSAQKEGKEALETAQQEADAVGEAGLVEGLIPIWGSGRDLIHAAQTGDGWGIGLNSLFLVWDVFSVVAGVVSYGAATAAMMGAKAGVRTALKAAGKVVLSAAKKKGANFLSKSAKIFKNLGPKIVEFTKGLKCKFLGACFPAGTPIAVKDGFKNIEDIQVGDEVWAWDEASGEVALKRISSTLQRQVHALVELTIDGEVIYATPEHPFFVDGNWKEAGLLEVNDQVQLFSSKNATVEFVQIKGAFSNADLLQVNDRYEVLDIGSTESVKNTTVYNLEVDGFATYFVGWIKSLVHNSTKGVCVKAGIDKFRRSMSERKKALLRDAADPKSGLSDRARNFIKQHKGDKVPKGQEVSHEVPLCNARTVGGKRKLVQ